MELVPEEQAASGAHHHHHGSPASDAGARRSSGLEEYLPLIVILGLITLATTVVALKGYSGGQFSWHSTMAAFMAGFFIVFAGFKLLDLPGFAHGYSTYDLAARRFPVYGYIYPFIELALGLAYLGGFWPRPVAWATLVIMAFSSLGVINALRQHRKFQCSCLGTVIKVPLTTVTLIEDLGMAVMALLFILGSAA